MEKILILCNAQNDIQAGIITELLENNNIPYSEKRYAAGSVFGSDRMFGVDILVPESAYETAKALMDSIFTLDDDAVYLDETAYEEGNDYENKDEKDDDAY